ncbi:MAG: PQQ-dependent sugar dehydrogenase, partial [Verrucomicrobiae bacterium]|nr:PQQ-dependent sugar dehydrogenase [Verrucomicrobiae bacterium]
MGAYTFQQTFTGASLNAIGTFQPVNFSIHNGRLFIVSKNGHVLLMTNATSAAITFIDNSADVYSVGDAGLIGFVMHPNGRTCYTFGNETNRTAGYVTMTLRKWTVDPANPNRVLAGSQVLLDQLDEHEWHAGGDLAFGPDGYLYLSVGDEGGPRCGYYNCQTITKDFFSGILRIDVDGRPGNLPPNPHASVRPGYWIPYDNPWVGATNFNGSAVDPAAVRTELWAVGFRNPWKIIFDGTDLYGVDVGEGSWEEVNRIVRGGNYGWNWLEGNEVTVFPEAPKAANRPSVAFNAPLWTYPHAALLPPGGDPRFAGDCIAGGIVYRGTRYPNLDGKLICGDYVSGNVWAISLTTPPVVEHISSSGIRITEIGLDPWTGEILVAEFASRKVFKLVPVSEPPSVPSTLSATRVFQDVSKLTPASGVLPYEVANPFWSDYAVKSRWFFMPPGQKITRDANNEWTFPAGSVWVKHFDLPVVRGASTTRRVETRFTVKTTSGLYGLTYRWRADGSDADLVPESGADALYPVEDSGGAFNQLWHYPSRGECSLCHNAAAGYVLGFSVQQLNVPATVSGGAQVNQLLGFSSLGVFEQPFSTVDGLPRLSRPNDESFTLEHRVKSYMDANCAYCHRPDGGTRSAWDGRFSTPMSSSYVIGEPVIDDLQITGAKIIIPGDLSRSVLYHRVADFVGHQVPETYHMPPLATYQRNEDAVSLLERYILSLPVRKVWQIGTDNLPNEVPYAPSGEFSAENGRNDAAPGAVTRIPGDPQYHAGANPEADDDFYFAGTYPAGFNGLAAMLSVPNDEPPAAWERAHTSTDLTNRVHFTLVPTQVTATAGLRLRIEFSGGTTVIGG